MTRDIGGMGKPVEILLVEDNPGDVRLTQEVLRDGKMNNNLYVATDGVDAVTFLRREGEYADSPVPDLILLDLNLPKKDGREVLAEIKADFDLKHIPTKHTTCMQTATSQNRSIWTSSYRWLSPSRISGSRL